MGFAYLGRVCILGLFYFCIIPLEVSTLGVILVDSEVGDGGLQKCVICRFSAFYFFELLNWGSGYGILQLRACCMSIFSFPELLENYWYHCFGYSFTYFIWRIVKYSIVHRLHCGCGQEDWSYWNFDACQTFCKFRLCYFHIARVSSYGMPG